MSMHTVSGRILEQLEDFLRIRQPGAASESDGTSETAGTVHGPPYGHNSCGEFLHVHATFFQ